MLFASIREPWTYCASHYHLNSELRDLKRIRQTWLHGRDCNSGPNAFARWLGIEFALTLDKMNDVRLWTPDRIAYALCPDIDTVVFVHHVPSTTRTDPPHRHSGDFSDLAAGPKACFTKKTHFKFQSEYRFAVSTHGDPVDQRHYITVSPELRELCREV